MHESIHLSERDAYSLFETWGKMYQNKKRVSNAGSCMPNKIEKDKRCSAPLCHA